MPAKTQSWYARRGSMGQGHIADEETGRSVAIAYDFEDAPLLAAAPDLLEACEAFLAGRPQCECGDDSGCSLAAARKLARSAIAKATAE